MIHLLAFLTIIVARSTSAAPAVAHRPPPVPVTRVDLVTWRERDAEIGRTAEVLRLLKRAAADPNPDGLVWRERGHRLFQHILYRASCDGDPDVTPETLARAYRESLSVVERSALRERAGRLVQSLLTDDPAERARFEKAKRDPRLVQMRVYALEHVAAAADRRGADRLGAKMRRELDRSRRALFLIRFERMLVEPTNCAAAWRLGPPR